MDTRYAATGSDDRQPVLVEVAGPVGIPVGKRLWLVDGDGQRAVFLGATAICVFDADDRDAQRVCIATLSKAGLAFDVEIGEAFGVHRNTVARLARQLDEQGMAGVVAAKRGPKGPHKVTDEVKAVIDGGAAAGLGPAEVRRRIVESTGVELSAEHVRQLMAARRSNQPDQLALAGDEPERDDSDEDDQAGHDDNHEVAGDEGTNSNEADEFGQDDDETVEVTHVVGGRAVDNVEGDADEAVEDGGSAGSFDPPAVLPHRVVGEDIGLTLFYPALAALGLVEIARQSFALPRSGR